MKSQGPPILPMYKVASNQKKKGGGLVSILIAVLLPIVVLFLLVFFFLSIYIGSSYLQEHLQDESAGGLLNSIGLPNTRNNIQKWSIDHLHGVDITRLGPPPKVVPQGLGSQHNQHRYNLSESLHSVNTGLDTITHRIGDSIHHIYYNSTGTYSQVHNSSAGSGGAKLTAWLNSFSDLHVPNITHSLHMPNITHSIDTHKLRTYISNTTSNAVRGISEYGNRGVKSVSELSQRVRNMRGGAVNKVDTRLYGGKFPLD